MKTGKKLLLTALSATLATTLTSGLALTAFADEATKDHEFDAKNDAVFENFDRADISDTVTGGSGVNTGEKPYLHVEYAALAADAPAGERNSQIYKQGSGSLGNFADMNSITLTMRAPKGDVTLSELNFALRGVDDEETVFIKDFTDIVDSEGGDLPELTSEWQEYEIGLTTSYEDTDEYSDANHTKVTQAALYGFHIFADAGETGTIEIGSISYKKTGSSLLNDFIGGENVQDTAKNADSGTWWAGSSTGYIVKRTVNMTSGSFTVVKDSAVGKYSYAVIEAEGDVENLKVATTTDGTTWGADASYDGYSVALTGNEKGFKFTYSGSEEGGVTVKRIYLTNVVIPVPDIAVPVIDASTVEVLEDFAVAQSGITDVWEDMSTAPQLEQAALEYRLSYSNGDKVEVKDGNLVFDAASLGDGYINYKFKTKAPVKGDYIVVKAKAEDGADLNGFRFALGNSEDVLGNVVWMKDMKAGVDLPTPLLGDGNLYKDGDWYYAVVDLDESGFRLFDNGYSIMDIYYSGAGKLYIDSVFFCNAIDVTVPNVEKDLSYPDAHIDVNASTGYAYGGYMYILNEGYGTTLEFDITPKEDNFDISNYRIEFEGVGVYWASENAQGTLKTTDGKKLNELTYTKGVATHVKIDLAASGIEGAFKDVQNHVSDMGGFTLTNVKLHTSTPILLAKDLDVERTHVVKEDDGTTNKVVNIAATTGYNHAGYVGSLNGLSGKFSIDITVDNASDLANLRLEFTSGKTLWGSENDQGVLYTDDGKMLSEVEFEAGVKKTVVLDLNRSGATLSDFNIHISDTTGAIKLENITVVPYVDYIGKAVEELFVPKYAEQMSKLSLVRDITKPEVSISTKTTAKVGDEITVSYTATDNVTATADLDVTVAVTKDGNAVTLTNNKFTAEEGVYTVTVTARDANGNEASDTIQITVTADEPIVTPPAETGCAGGCGSIGAEGGFIIGGMALMGISVLLAVNAVVRRKKNNG